MRNGDKLKRLYSHAHVSIISYINQVRSLKKMVVPEMASSLSMHQSTPSIFQAASSRHGLTASGSPRSRQGARLTGGMGAKDTGKFLHARVRVCMCFYLLMYMMVHGISDGRQRYQKPAPPIFGKRPSVHQLPSSGMFEEGFSQFLNRLSLTRT